MNDKEAMRLAQAATQAMARGDAAEAQRLASLLLQQRPADANAHQVLGLLALRAGDAATAREHLEQADAAVPGQAAIINALAGATRATGDVARARALFRCAGELGLADAWRNLGNLDQGANDYAAAIVAYENAARLQPNDARAHAGLAHAFEQRHDVDRAKASAERALSLAPDNEIARIVLARLELRAGKLAEAEAAAAPVTRATSATNRAIAWGLVGEARDKRGAPREAFAAFTQANRALLEKHSALLGETTSPYHPDSVRRLTAFAERAHVSRWTAPTEAGAPIFLVGFPRSGTTLLDQILSSHSQLFCVEERESLALTIEDLAISDAKLARELSEAEVDTRRTAYLRRLDAEAGDARGRKVIDKLPLNVVFLPLMRRLFPGARIIFALRDPRDAVLSCFQQRFGMNPAMVQFLQLETAAAYYDMVMRLYEVSRNRLGLAMHVVRYEDVVADLEGAAHGLAAFLGVEFEPAMLEFRETARKRAIKTPSARQVTQPLYARSVGRWRAYAADLAPVLPALNAWARRFDYDA